MRVGELVFTVIWCVWARLVLIVCTRPPPGSGAVRAHPMGNKLVGPFGRGILPLGVIGGQAMIGGV